MVTKFRINAMAVLALFLALPNLANAQDINLATGGADLVWKGQAAGTNAGAWMDLGDMSGDARRDLIIGAPGNSATAGKVYVLYGGGAERTGTLSLGTADVIISSSEAGNRFGAATASGNVLSLDDTNPKNLIIGAPGALGGRGAAYLYATAWAIGTRTTTDTATMTILGAPGDQLGSALATGDLDKDGHREMIIGAPGNNRIYIIKGSATLSGTIDLTSPPAGVVTYSALGIGRVLIAGDITGDGIYDVLVGSPSTNLVFGLIGAQGAIPTFPAVSFSGGNAGDETGASIRILDLDDDRVPDLAIGAPGGDGPGNGRTDAGNVYVFLGPISVRAHAVSEAQLVFYGAAANARAGSHMATGDINRDTPNDLVILSPNLSGGAGELDIYYGRVRASLGTGTAAQKVVDMATPGQVSRHIFGDPSVGPIAFAQVYEVTGEGARDVIVGIPTDTGNTGKLFFTISPRMKVSRFAESLAANQGDSAISATPIDITNPSVVVTGWRASATVPWLSTSPLGGSISETSPNSMRIIASASGMTPGTYTGRVNITAISPDLTMTLGIDVTFTVTGATVQIDTPADNATVSNGFTVSGWAIDVATTAGTGVSAVEGYAFPAAGGTPVFLGIASYGGARSDVGSTFGPQFTNSGYGLVVRNLTPGQNYRVVMFAKSSVSGNFAASKTVRVSVSASSAPAGPNPTDPNPAPPPDPAAPPTDPGIPGPNTRMAVNRSALWFGATNNGGLMSGTQRVAVTFTQGSGSWAVSSDASWLTISPSTGTGSGLFNVSVNPGTYPNGTVRNATLTITAPGVGNSPLTLPVRLSVLASTSSPAGTIETPANNTSGVVGAIPITGWALDDVALSDVSIYRDPMPGEPVSSANGKVFIGKAAQVDGARPDVDAVWNAPFDYQAGWGYMLLTNFLPNQGNGTFTLHAYATDVEGHTILLGSRTITCDNGHATKPFGTIDTPEQGGIVSGSQYVNFGWVLGAQDNVIPFDGSTITVFIDGVPVGHPQYNFERSDIKAFFPGHANTNGAIGFFVINTTTLSNGVHTIAWGVSDAAGHNDGIGSRFFTVLNGVSSSLMTTPALLQGSSGLDAVTRESAPAGAETGQPVAALAAVPVSETPSYTQQGFAMNAPLEIVEKDVTGPATITTEELGVIRATVGAPVSADAADDSGYEGYMVNGGRLDALPAGSFLDRRSGEFFWHPGAGFVGTYDFVFIRKTDGLRERIPVSVVIEPRRAKSELLPSRTIR